MEIYTLLHGSSPPPLPPPPLRSCTRDYYQSIGNIHQHVIIVVGARTVWHKVIGFIFIWGHFTNTLSYSQMVFLQTTTPCVDFYILKKFPFQLNGA